MPTNDWFSLIISHKVFCSVELHMHLSNRLLLTQVSFLNFTYVSQHIKRDQLSQKIKMDILLFPKWLFFRLNFDAKIKFWWNQTLRSWDTAILLRMSKQIGEKLIVRKRLLKFGNLYEVLVFWQSEVNFYMKTLFFAQNPSSNLKIKYWRF